MEPGGSEWMHALRCSIGEGLTLIGRSRAADSTGFVVPELGMALDAGVVVGTKPTTVLLSHTHAGTVVAQFSILS